MSSTRNNPVNDSTSVNSFGQLGYSSGTAVNSPVVTGPAPAASLDLEQGTELPGSYTVIRRIGNAADSGEADVFLCEKNGLRYAAKIFRRDVNVKQELIDKLSSIRSENIARMYYHGEVFGRHFEVYDYYERGSLADTLKRRTFSENELRDFIIPNLNSALHALHQQGILHRDIKPSNIMWANDERWKLVLIDFGLSSVIRESLSVVVSQVGFTTAYAAPEVLRNVYFDESDYFSLGIVLYELFCGTTPFTNQDNVLTSTITKPGNMPQDLYNLILGLTYPELTHRHDDKNPNRRWAYREVCKWLSREEQPVPGLGGTSGESERSIPPIRFCDKTYTDIDALCYAMALNWESSKQLVLRMTLRDHLRNRRNASDNHLLWASIIDDVVNNSGYDNDERVLRVLHGLSPEAPYIYCSLGAFSSAKEFGDALFDRLSSGYADTVNGAANAAEAILKSGTLSEFVAKHPGQTVTAGEVQAFERRRLRQDWQAQRIAHLFELAYRLTQRTELDVGLPDRTVFHSVDDLKGYLAGLGTGDFRELYRVCGYLLDGERQMKPKVYGWMKHLGCDVSEFNQ